VQRARLLAPGYGASEALPEARTEGRHIRKPDFMHVEAWETLAGIARRAGPGPRGAVLAIPTAARSRCCTRPGMMSPAPIVMAPHVRVEKVSITSIEAAKVAYETTDLRARLANIP